MRKRAIWRSILVLVLCCSLVLNVFAATTTETIEKEDGTLTVITTETESWTETDSGDGHQPPVTVALTPGAETTATSAPETVITDNIMEDADDLYDTTTTTTVDRTVTAETSDAEVTDNSADTDVAGVEPDGKILDAAEEYATTVINENNFVKDVSLTVNDKADDYAANTDAATDNDIYNVDLNFKLAFMISENNDDLLVYVSYVDPDGNTVNIVKRLSGANGEGEDYEAILPEADGTYILRGLKMGEGKDNAFDLRLGGTQYLEPGIYTYQSADGEISEIEASGDRNVDISMSLNVKFDVNEDNQVEQVHEWSTVTAPSVNDQPSGDGYNDVPAGGDKWTAPPAGNMDQDAEEELVEIEEEEVPLADVPDTGDASILFAILTVLSVCGLAVLAVTKKREQN